MPSDLSKELQELAIAQSVTQTQLGELSRTVRDYIGKNDERCDDQTDDKLESVRLMAEIATTLRDVKDVVEEIKKKDLPAICKENDKLAAKVNTHDWLIKAMVAATVIASLGSAWAGANACNGASTHERDREAQVSKLDR